MSPTGNILIVDDEERIRFFLSEILSSDGHQVTTAASGAEAFGYINTHEYDLALLDLNLPDMNGLTVLAKLKQISPDTAAIILTAHASVSSSVEALRQGSHDYLLKPCRAGELRESIKRGLTKRRKLLQQRHLVNQLGHLAGVLQDIQDNSEDALLENTILGQAVSSYPVNLEAYQVENNPVTTSKKPAVVIGSHSTKEVLSAAGDSQNQLLQYHGLVIDPLRHIITYHQEPLPFSSTEFDLLTYLVDQSPRVVSPQELITNVLGYDGNVIEAGEIIRQHVYRMRGKIKAVTGKTEIIRTVRSVGYTIKS